MAKIMLRIIAAKSATFHCRRKRHFVVIMDYEEYLRLKEIEEDRGDYYSALQVKIKDKKWKTHEDLKKELGLD
ncbi:MAG: hypothetical protein Q7J31_04890 [Syntrophales bacterium]|nr:hypothetical protein [Syntrophales bacterium]